MKNTLKTYKRKRDFNITSEPSESRKLEVKNKKNKRLLFVVQEHHASHLHYDFRLELDGVLKSWAIPKGPSLSPDDKRLAVEVEDHPLSYATFHGTIPEGQYGSGEVYIWDKGTWQVKGDPQKSLKTGKLEFTLKGKKLKGNFVLVRMPDKKPNAPHNWLLIKRADVDADPKKKGQNLKKNKPDKWPGFVPPQLALLVETPPEDNNWIHEIKYDGYRIQTHILNSNIKMFTRGSLDWSKQFPTIIKAFKDINVESAIFDGEIVVVDKLGRSHFGQLQEAISTKNYESMRIYLFDLLYLNGEDLRKYPLKKRKDLLKKILLKVNNPIFYSEHISTNATSFLRTCCLHKLEGIVSKDPNAPYTSGRSRSWMKCKCNKHQEFIIGGYTDSSRDSRGKVGELGALLLGVHDKGHGENIIRYVGKVGTGFDNKTLREMKKRVSKLEQKKSPFDINSPRNNHIHWISPELVAEIKFSNWTSGKLLRNPVYLGFRSETKAVVLTHPQKILIPYDKVTKEQIADFYEAVANVMLPLITDRPISLVRCTQNSGKKCFYQRHPGNSSVLRNLKCFTVKNKADHRLYFTLDSTKNLTGQLRELVQMNVIEIHTWNCHYQALRNPDQIVMDFDPAPDVSFKEVVKACLQMKKMLDKLKLKSFVKVTGGKGVHIHIPIEPVYSWDEVKAFSKALAEEMVSMYPHKFMATLSKRDRKGKIFIDYLRNSHRATAIAPYSLRARKQSSVALPVDWKELSKIKSSDQFTLRKALLKIKNRKSDPWKDMLKIKQKISILDGFNKQ